VSSESLNTQFMQGKPFLNWITSPLLLWTFMGK